MIASKTFYLDKSTDPFADTLAAHGLAAVLRWILEQSCGPRRGVSVRMVDCGAYYQLDCSVPIDDTVINACSGPLVLFRAIRTAKNASSLAELPDYACLDYEAVRDQRAAYFEWFDALPKELKRAAMAGEFGPDAPPAPHRHWDILRAVNPATLQGHNNLALTWWRTRQALPQVLHLLLTMVSAIPNDVEGAIQAWKDLDHRMGWGIGWDATALQLFNPGRGKGQNRPKADSLSMSNVSGFWLLEWLKVVGFYQVGVTRQIGGLKRTGDIVHASGFYQVGVTRQIGGGDRKSYALAPVNIDSGHLSEIMHQFGQSMTGSEKAIQLDILASLRFTKAMLRYAQENQASDLWKQLMGSARPRDIVGGFHAAFYKKLGQSVATMNLSFIALPAWVSVQDAADVSAMLALLEEHEQIIRQFDESHSDEVTLLQSYRDFLSGDDLSAFFTFTTQYAGFIIGRWERNLPARQFTTGGIGRLLMSTQTSFYEIVQNEGFQHVAYAIRQSTVTAQYRKKQGDRRYDVRYGLHLELARTARQPERFIAALGEFMAKYNAENAQVMETRPGPYRTSLSTADIEQIVRLVDQYGSEVVCNLLIAYGYARIPREDVEGEQSPDIESQEE